MGWTRIFESRHRVLRTAGLLVFILLAFDLSSVQADGLLGIRTGNHGESLRIVLDLEGEPPCTVRPIEDSDDWLIEVAGGCPSDPPARIRNPHQLIRAIEPSCRETVLQISLLAARPFGVHAFMIPPRDGMPARYVVDLSPAAGARSSTPPSHQEPPQEEQPEQASETQSEQSSAIPPEPEPVPEPQPRRKGPWRIVIDPGHGGSDPGATAQGIQEKELVLDVAREIEAIFDEFPGFEAQLTRGMDRYVGLRRRLTFAEDYEADAFLSIHANAARASRAVGVEVFFLSLGGASDQASLELARLENEADPEYVVEEDAMLQEIPFGFDLRQTDTIRRSSRLAETVLTHLEDSGLAASRGVKQAGFVVLKSFQVPSILVEIGFLSNPTEAKRLKTAAHRRRLAETIAAGTMSYFEQYARTRGQENSGGE